MMIEPPLEALFDRAGTRYAAVVIAAVRAKQLGAGAAALIETEIRNPVAVALNELASGRLHVDAPVVKPETERDRAPV